MNWPEHISPAEFEDPEHMAPQLVAALGETRQWLGRPMWFSRTANGQPLHPKGDAISPTGAGHAPGSLHRYHIDHAESYRQGRIVLDPGQLCLACDWDCESADAVELWETYLTLERLNLWSGVGLYVAWNRRGFHTDLRSDSHPAARARWFRDASGAYHPLTWANYRRELGL